MREFFKSIAFAFLCCLWVIQLAMDSRGWKW